MKKIIYISALVLSTILGASNVQAEDITAPMKEKGIVGSMADAVKNTVGDVKKAITHGDPSAEVSSVEQDSEAGAATEASASVAVEEKAAPKTMAVETKAKEDDTKDAEANRKVSDVSIAIFSQNPYIQTIMEKTTHIKSSRLKELLARGDKVTLLDIRPRSEFAQTPGIKGTALNIPRNFLEVEAYEKLPNKDASIIIVSTKGIRGGLAAHTLQNMGYTDVRNLMDGLEGWNKDK